MRYIFVFLTVAILFFSLCSSATAQELGAKALSEIIQEAIPVEFGYVDNTSYCMHHDLENLSGIDDSYVVVCAEATNFNEFGVFHCQSSTDTKHCVKQLNEFLEKRKTQFRSGVIYDINEYPKFENAKVISFGQYVIYVILDAPQSDKAIRAVKAALS